MVLAVALGTRPAEAHEPFQITTEARVLRDALALHVTMASRTATLACPGVVGGTRSLRAEDLERYRASLDACARGLYVVTSAGRALAPSGAVISLTEEGDFDARIRYPPAATGALVFDAVHLARIPDAMFGAELTVTSERAFLGQALLRASASTLALNVPATREPSGTTTPHVPSFWVYVPRWISAVIGLLGLCWLARRLLA